MKINKLQKIHFLIIIFLLSARLYSQNTCIISATLFRISPAFCSENKMGADYNQSRANLEVALDRIRSKFTSTTNDLCIPDGLENLMRDRICNNSNPITIHCLKGTNKEVIQKSGHWYIICKKKFLFFTFKKKVEIVRPPAGNTSYTAIFLPPELLSSSIDEIEQTLFHELIHWERGHIGNGVRSRY
jgi:hypothetical protein